MWRENFRSKLKFSSGTVQPPIILKINKLYTVQARCGSSANMFAAVIKAELNWTQTEYPKESIDLLFIVIVLQRISHPEYYSLVLNTGVQTYHSILNESESEC